MDAKEEAKGSQRDAKDSKPDAEDDAKDAKDDARGDAEQGAPEPPPPDAGPEGPTKLPRGALWKAVKRSVKEFIEDNLTDWSAALTYYGVLSIFPGLLVLVSVLGLLGPSAIQPLIDNIGQITPGPVRLILENAANALEQAQGTAGITAIIGLAVALWSSSGYVAAFMRASNAIYDVPEGRPIWKTVPIRIGVTLATGVLLLLSAVIVVLTGEVAEQAGRALGLESVIVTSWNIVKWPVLLVLVTLMFAILYWASPNARQGGFRWVSPGGIVAVLLWIAASAGFAVYVANFASYNKTYGTLAGVIVFLVWLWISNLAILFGAEVNAELERQRSAAAGHPEDAEPYLQLRDDRKVKKGADRDLGQ
jgi:membrane protein